MTLVFCTECAAPLQAESSTVYRCANGHVYFNNPHAACSVVFIKTAHELLFAKRAFAPKKGSYDFPGGFLNYDENAYQAAVREIQEELTVIIDPTGLELIDCSLALYSKNTTMCDVVFLCQNWNGEMRAQDDVAALDRKPMDFLLSDQFAWPYPYLYNKLRTRMIAL